jgi:molybdopterin synthase sulfur carrier subunit
MRLRWKLFANLAETAGEREVTVTVDEATVDAALDALFETYPELRDEVLDDEGVLYDHVRLLHDSEDPFARADGLATAVEPEDELALFPPVSGG